MLTARLRAAGLGRDVVISTFGRHYRLPWTADAGLRVPSRSAAPCRRLASPMAPAWPRTAFRRCSSVSGIQGLARLYPDVYAPDVEFFSALFPPLTADLLTYYLPW